MAQVIIFQGKKCVNSFFGLWVPGVSQAKSGIFKKFYSPLGDVAKFG
jgi:hypothetical protein